MHPLDIGLVVNRVARFVGGSHCSHHVSVLEFVSKGMRAHFNAKLRLEIHLLGILEFNRARASEDSEDSEEELYWNGDPWGDLTWIRMGPNAWEQGYHITCAMCRTDFGDEDDY